MTPSRVSACLSTGTSLHPWSRWQILPSYLFLLSLVTAPNQSPVGDSPLPSHLGCLLQLTFLSLPALHSLWIHWELNWPSRPQECCLPGSSTGQRSLSLSVHYRAYGGRESSPFFLLFTLFPLNPVTTWKHSCHLILPPLSLRQIHVHPITFPEEFGSWLIIFFCTADPTNCLGDIKGHTINPWDVLD